jgi:hypothetical protein
MFETKAMFVPSGDHVEPPTCRVIYSFSMVRLRGSTSALGLDEIFFGSVTASGWGKVWAAISVTTVLITMTIANRAPKRMTRDLTVM